jgi:outer membrane protein assembly factor BamB
MPRRTAPALFAVLALAAAGADWRQFRGPAGAGVADGPAPPAELAADRHLAWKADLPDRGVSGPVVVGGRVFVTASGGPRQDRLHVLVFDAATGRQLWQRGLWATGPTTSHPKTCMAAPTPASDGRRLVALFATNDLACFDLDGNLLWARALYEENPGATDGRGLASSPIIVGDTVVVHAENQNVSFAAGIDLATGADRWRADRPRVWCWTTPTVLPGRGPGGDLVLLQGSTRLSAVEPRTGREVWHLERKNHAIASAVVHGTTLFVPGEEGLAALELQSGDEPPKVRWESPKLSPSTASPVVLGDRVYCLRGSILAAGDTQTGAVVGQLRLRGSFSASPVAAGGLLYCVSEDGVVQVVRPGEKEPAVAASGDLKETILGTPAVADGAVYFRSNKYLWKFAK